jgi:lipopolysaccharide/colanic/teichoic acid biosynthesis glycosyltransferase
MLSTNTPMTNSVPKHKWIRVSDFASEHKKVPFKYLYIGNNEEVEKSLKAQFESGCSVVNLMQAKKLILCAVLNKGQSFADVTFIDLPFDRNEFRAFCYFLKLKESFAKTVLIYNKQQLSKEHIQYFRACDLIDDIVNLQVGGINYHAKISFLKRLKKNQKRHHMFVVRETPGHESTAKGISYFFKRLVDVTVSLVLLTLLLPVFFFVALIIKLESKGPVFYTSLRAGRGFKIFKFYKFRSMVQDADAKVQKLSHLNQYGSKDKAPVFFKLKNDPRVTKFGKFLRNTSLDELPQLFNVLKGDMSLVGNRPLPLYEAATLTTNEYVERFSATAGITGLWQVTKRGKAEMSAEERINLDITYARKENFFYDFWIMAKTPAALFQKSDV